MSLENHIYTPWPSVPYYDYLRTTCLPLANEPSEEYNFNLEGAVMSSTGWGLPEIDYTTSRTPYQHGDSFEAYRGRPREISMRYVRNACDRDDYWRIRSEIIEALRPNRVKRADLVSDPVGSGDLLVSRLGHGPGQWGPGRLTKILPNGSPVAVDAFWQDGLIFNPDDPDEWDAWSIDENLSFVCPNPYVYDPEFIVEDITPSLLNNTFILDYYGTWQTYPIIEIVGDTGLVAGELTNAIEITNVYPTPQTISMRYSPGERQKIVIELAPGNKTAWLTTDIPGLPEVIIQNVFGYAVLNTSVDDIAFFSIGPFGDKSKCGDPKQQNRLRVRNVPDGVTIRIKYYVRYIGV